jgi:hypothetical protein
MQGSIEEWKRCNYKIPYTYEIKSSIKYHIDLGIKGYRRLIYRLLVLFFTIIIIFIRHTMTLYSLVDMVCPCID